MSSPTRNQWYNSAQLETASLSVHARSHQMYEDNEVLDFTEYAGGPCQDPQTMGYRVLRHGDDCIVQSWGRPSTSSPTGGQTYPGIRSSWQQIGSMSASQFEDGVLDIVKKLDWKERYSVPGLRDGGGWSLKVNWGAYEFKSSGHMAKPADYDDVRERIIRALRNQRAKPNIKDLLARIHNRFFPSGRKRP